MIDFVQLKKVAQEAQESQVPFTINSTQILELLSIQAQLVEDVKEILASLQAANDDCDGPITDTIWMRGARNETVFEAIENALSAVGAQP